jgi:hypothetical protein
MKVSESNLTPNHFRPFKLVPKGDGRPAVEVESDGKNKQYVRVTPWIWNFELYFNNFG